MEDLPTFHISPINLWLVNVGKYSSPMEHLGWIKSNKPKHTRKVADLSPKNMFGNYPPQMVPMDLNVGETRVWRLDSTGIIKLPFWGDQTMQIYGDF